MKSTRKGFTLVELLVVIAVIGILATMTLLGGTEATNIAKAARITDEFEKLSSIMMTYYADNYSAADSGDVTEAQVVKAVKARVRDADSTLIVESSAAAIGKYAIDITNAKPAVCWLHYQLEDENTKVGAILSSKSNRFGFKKAKNSASNDYAGGKDIYMKVR